MFPIAITNPQSLVMCILTIRCRNHRFALLLSGLLSSAGRSEKGSRFQR